MAVTMAVTMVTNHFQFLGWSSTYGEKKITHLPGWKNAANQGSHPRKAARIPSKRVFAQSKSQNQTTYCLKLTHNSMVWRKKLNSTSNFERTCWNQERLRSAHLESINTSNHSTRHVHKIFFKMSWLAQVQNVDRAWLRSKHARANIIDEEAGPSLS